MPAAHQRSWAGHDRRVLTQAVKRGPAARPARGVENDVRQPHCCDELLLRHRWQDDAILFRIQTERGERAAQPLPERCRNGLAFREADEVDELASANRGRNLRVDAVELPGKHFYRA